MAVMPMADTPPSASPDDGAHATLHQVGRAGARPTLGAVLRARGLEPGMCEEARVAFAWELVCEAVRRAVIDRLDDILTASVNDPQTIAGRLRRLADELDPPDYVIDRQEAA
jgi:hypothetical protein